MAGYSGTPLSKKLGIKPDGHVAVLSIPEDFDRSSLEGADVRTSLRSKEDINVAIVFCRTESNLARAFERIQPRLAPAGAVWIAWPKKASGLKTELSGDIVRSFGLDQGFVDNKVCAIDDTWSGLRFVIRVKDRARYAATRKRQ